MLRLEDIMTQDLVTVSPDLPLRSAMELLTSRHISGAPVVSRGKVIGVVSLTDLAEFAAATPGVPTSSPDAPEWGEIEGPLDWLEGDEPAALYFAEMWDDAGADVVERMANTASAEWNALEEHTVGEAMTRKVLALAPETAVEQAAEVMRRAGIHRVLVIGDGELRGVVTTKDIANAVADQRLTKRIYVFGKPDSCG